MLNSDTRIIKASFKDCPLDDRKFFHRSKCLIPISVGQHVHEGQKFLAYIQLINRSFKACTILIDDSIQRHTLKISNTDLSDELSYKQSIEDGIRWRERNQIYLNQLTIPNKIEHWDKWLNHPNFKVSHEEVKNLYYSDSIYHEAVNANIEEFLSRYVTRDIDNNFNYKRAFALCLDYLMEECAVMCLWAEEDYAFEVYPTGRNKAMTATYQHLIKPTHSNLLRSVALRFKKYANNTLANTTHKHDLILAKKVNR